MSVRRAEGFEVLKEEGDIHLGPEVFAVHIHVGEFMCVSAAVTPWADIKCRFTVSLFSFYSEAGL